MCNSHRPFAPVACIFGMLGQSWWFYSTWTAQQWGILVLCVIYCGAWMHGVWIHWIRPAPAESRGTVQLVPRKWCMAGRYTG